MGYRPGMSAGLFVLLLAAAPLGVPASVGALTRYEEDRSALMRRYDIPLSPVRRARLERFYQGWLDALADMDFDALNHEGQVDYVLLRNRMEFELEMLEQEATLAAEMDCRK